MMSKLKLQGSCLCGAVKFSLSSSTPVPYLKCYCTICRKTNGGGGYAINLGGDAKSLEIEGKDSISIFHAMIDGKESPAERRFCSKCGTSLWLWDPRWPEFVHPFASAIDTPLPKPPQSIHIMLDSKPDWVEIDQNDDCFAQYPEESLEEWHKRNSLPDGDN